jgi:hypothetical protein
MTRRKPGPSKGFSGRYAAQSLTRKRRHGHTAARISAKRLRQAMLRIVRLRTSQPQRRGVSPTSGGRRQPQAGATKKPIYRMERRSRVNQVLLRVRSLQMRATSKFSVFRREPLSKIRTQAKFSLRRKYRRISRPRFTPRCKKT